MAGRILRDGRLIESLEDWQRRAGPKSADQWRGGRSAKEVARAWLEASPTMPREVVALMATAPSSFGPMEDWTAQPEVKLELDGFPGEPRNTDLLIDVSDSFGPFVIAVEAKADEPFGETVADALAAAVERAIVSEASRGVARVERLARMLFAPRRREPRPGEPKVGALRYQLLTATGGLLTRAASQGASRAVLLVHEFQTYATSTTKHEANARDLDAFAERISRGAYQHIEPGHLYGPIRVRAHQDSPGAPDLYIGKAVRVVPDPWPQLRVLAQHGAARFVLGESPSSLDGFLVDGPVIERMSPATLLAQKSWSEPTINSSQQKALLLRAKGQL